MNFQKPQTSRKPANPLEPHRRKPRACDKQGVLFRSLGPAAVCVASLAAYMAAGCAVLLAAFWVMGYSIQLAPYMGVSCEAASWPEGSAPVAAAGDKSYLNEQAPLASRYGVQSIQEFMRAATPAKEAEPARRGPFANVSQPTCPVPGSGSCEATVPLPMAPPYAGGYDDEDGGRRLFKGLFRKLIDRIKHRGPVRERFGGAGGLFRKLLGKMRR